MAERKRDPQKFSFESATSATNEGPENSFAAQSLPETTDRSRSGNDTSADGISFHKASFESYHSASSTPSKPALLSTASSRRSSPGVRLTLETSTPVKPEDNSSGYISDSSRGDFSFINTSGANPDVLNIGSTKLNATPAPRPLSHLPRSAPHSRNSSISWSVQVPEEWTMERVQLWLELYMFNESWTSTFRRHNLVGEDFLKLTNYQNLKKYKDELETTDDSTPSRFIHSLRKTLDRPTSTTALSVGSPLSANSSSSSFGSTNSVSDVSDEVKTRARSASEAGPSIKSTTSFLSSSFDGSPEELKPYSTSIQQRLTGAASKRRPVSTIESSSRGLPLVSSASSQTQHGLFRRQHKKSSSSESSLFTSLFSSSTSYLPQTADEKRPSVSSREGESRGILSKLRKKTDKKRNKDFKVKERDAESPVSPNSSSTDRSSMFSTTSHDPTSNNLLEVNTAATSKMSADVPFVIHRKFHPIPKNKNSDKYVLATVDNMNFRPINIGQITDKDEFRDLLIDTLLPEVSNVTIHLTDFDCSIGEALDDQTLDRIVSNRFDLCSGKFLITSTDTLSTIYSSSMTITNSDIQSFESKESKLYPNTPQHYYEADNLKDPTVNYWNFKDVQNASVEVTSSSAKPGSQLSDESRSQSYSSQSSNLVPTGSSSKPQLKPSASEPPPPKPSLSRKKPQKPLVPQNNSTFRVIRPTEKGEINFDKRRESPYSKPDLVAKRSAPPPPKPKRLFEKLPSIKTDTRVTQLPWLEPVKESSTNSGTFIAPYTPSSSNTLIPEPYKGGSSVSPIFRKAIEDDFEKRASDLSNCEKDPAPEAQRISRTYSSGVTKRTFSSRTAANKFKENTISFDDAPQLEDEDEEEDEGSDEDFWAKAPSDVQRQSSTMSEMIVRPAPEVLYDNLERFFPDADLDRPVIDLSTPPTSPSNERTVKGVQPQKNINHGVAVKPSLKRVVSSSNTELETLRRPQRMKTIRAVAKEAGEARKRESSIKNNIAHNRAPLVRRQSTKMWGRKVIEVKPNQKQYISKLRKDKNDDISEFSWIKGELIGKGTFGNVYIALNVTTGEMIAVKQVQLPNVPQKNSRVSDVIEALRSEVDTLKDLDHLNIVQYLGFEETSKVYNLFLEYVAGGSVASCLRLHGRFDEPLIKFLTSQVLEGLSYLHSRGILHRDMKADNLLLDLDGVCKISDFGISKKSNDIYENDAGMSMQGTIFWMAPEVVDSRGEGYSAKVDIWSIGCVVLEMFAGRRPWSNLEAIPAMLKIGKAKAAPPIPEDTLPLVSMEGRSFLDSCFITNPHERPTAQRLSKDGFCKIDPNFNFAYTRLAKLIKANEKKVIV